MMTAVGRTSHGHVGAEHQARAVEVEEGHSVRFHQHRQPEGVSIEIDRLLEVGHRLGDLLESWRRAEYRYCRLGVTALTGAFCRDETAGQQERRSQKKEAFHGLLPCRSQRRLIRAIGRPSLSSTKAIHSSLPSSWVWIRCGAESTCAPRNESFSSAPCISSTLK